MIDFRYHVVSLVAVFLALAVGVVLGAGPLRGQLSETLEGQVADLGSERNELRAQLSHQEDVATAYDSLLGTVSSRATADVVTGADVSVVALPGSDGDLADDVATSLAGAGAGILSRTRVLDSAEDPDQQDRREEALTALEPLVGSSTDIDGALAAAILGVGPDGTFIEAGAVGTTLQQAGLLEVTGIGDSAERVLPGVVDVGAPDLVVVVAGGIAAQDAQGAEEAARLSSRQDLLTALSAGPTPVLVVGAGATERVDPQELAVDPLLALVRADPDLADRVATTDDAESAGGLVTLAWTAAWALSGEVGHYGLGTDADAVAPPVPAVRSGSQDTSSQDTPSQGTPTWESPSLDTESRTSAP